MLYEREVKWVVRASRKFKVSAERRLEIRIHTRQHGGPLKHCAECQALQEKFLTEAAPVVDRPRSDFVQVASADLTTTY